MLDDSTREQMALFRYGLIADLAQRQEDEKGLYRLLLEKADKDYVIPGSRRTRVAAEAIRDWLKAFRRGGFAALRPQPAVLSEGGGGPSGGARSQCRRPGSSPPLRVRGDPERHHLGQGAAGEGGGDLAGDPVGGGA